MCKLQLITHKLYIKPSGYIHFVSDSPEFTHLDKIHKIKFVPIIIG